jgi:virginiamycin B lyase
MTRINFITTALVLMVMAGAGCAPAGTASQSTGTTPGAAKTPTQRPLSPPSDLIEFPLPTSAVAHTPVGISTGPDGNLWFTEYAGNKIGRITPSGQITEFPLPTPNNGPFGITDGPDGNLWFTEQAHMLGRITTAGQVAEFPLLTPNSNPGEITQGSDGNLWFTESGTNQIGHITPGT